MFKLVIAFVALATIQGVCGVPVTKQSAQVQPYPDLLSRLLGIDPIAGYPFKRQIDASVNAVAGNPSTVPSFDFVPLSQADTLLRRDGAAAEFYFPDISGLLGGLLGRSASDEDQAHGVLLKRLIQDIIDEDLDSSDMLQKRQFPIPGGLFRGLIPLPTSVQQALAKLKQSQAAH